MNYDYLIVGAGFTGSVMAERIALVLNKKVLVVEKRNHIAGNAFDEYDPNGILVHRYGPHIFHTNSKEVFEYLSQFTEWRKYEHKVLANLNGQFYPVPINRTTINKLYKKDFRTEKELTQFYNSIKEKRYPILNSEDIIINQVGEDLFKKFFFYYTKKQWGLEPRELSAAVCGRIPVRSNDDDRYFTDRYQFMPTDGYTKMFEKMLSHKNIEVVLETDYKNILKDISFKKLIYTGPIDYYFDYKFGQLPYRSIRFEWKHLEHEYHQQAAQINYVDESEIFTRVIEHKYLSGQKSAGTTLSYEFPQKDGDPFYPIPVEINRRKYLSYNELTKNEKNVYFVGRLAEYQYYNMDQVVINALKYFKEKISI